MLGEELPPEETAAAAADCGQSTEPKLDSGCGRRRTLPRAFGAKDRAAAEFGAASNELSDLLTRKTE